MLRLKYQSASWADNEGPSQNAFARLLGGFRCVAPAESRLVRFRCMHADPLSGDGGQFMSLFQIKQDDSCYQWFPPMQRHRNDTINARDCCSKSHRPLPWRPVVRVQLPRSRYGVRQHEPTLTGWIETNVWMCNGFIALNTYASLVLVRQRQQYYVGEMCTLVPPGISGSWLHCWRLLLIHWDLSFLHLFRNPP